MNTILHIETPVHRSELAGEPIGEYERSGVSEWFDIRPLSSREYVQGQQIQSSVTHELKCRHFAGANTAMRLVTADGLRTFNVESVVNENEANRHLVWRCTEVA